MNLLRKVVGDLMGQVKSKRVRKPRPRRPGLGSLVEQLETRAMLSQVNLVAPIVAPPSRAEGPAIILSTQAPIFKVDATVPVGAGALDVTEGGGQIGVQLDHKLDVTEGGGQIGVQLDRR